MNERQKGLKRLLNDILRDEPYCAFRENTRRRSLDAIRGRKRRRRNIRVAAVVAAAAGILIAFLLPSLLRPPVPTFPSHTQRKVEKPANRYVIRSRPLSQRHLVRPTIPQVVSTAHQARWYDTHAPVDLQARVHGTLHIVETRDVRTSLKNISDEQLLAMFGERPCGLIRTGPLSKRLLLFDREDQRRVFGENGLNGFKTWRY